MFKDFDQTEIIVLLSIVLGFILIVLMIGSATFFGSNTMRWETSKPIKIIIVKEITHGNALNR